MEKWIQTKGTGRQADTCNCHSGKWQIHLPVSHTPVSAQPLLLPFVCSSPLKTGNKWPRELAGSASPRWAGESRQLHKQGYFAHLGIWIMSSPIWKPKLKRQILGGENISQVIDFFFFSPGAQCIFITSLLCSFLCLNEYKDLHVFMHLCKYIWNIFKTNPKLCLFTWDKRKKHTFSGSVVVMTHTQCALSSYWTG